MQAHAEGREFRGSFVSVRLNSSDLRVVTILVMRLSLLEVLIDYRYRKVLDVLAPGYFLHR